MKGRIPRLGKRAPRRNIGSNRKKSPMTLLVFSLLLVSISAERVINIPTDDMLQALKILWEEYQPFILFLTVGSFGTGFSTALLLASVIGCFCSCGKKQPHPTFDVHQLDGYSALDH